jgi:hypothetical protein
MKNVLRALSIPLSLVFFYLATVLTGEPDSIIPIPEGVFMQILYGLTVALGIVFSCFAGVACLIFAFDDD